MEIFWASAGEGFFSFFALNEEVIALGPWTGTPIRPQLKLQAALIGWLRMLSERMPLMNVANGGSESLSGRFFPKGYRR